jgi:hypothetical protein
MEDPEQCPKCQTLGERRFVPSRVFFSKTKVTHAGYDPALGKVIANERHLKDELSKHEEKTGSKMVAVGNDFGGGEKHVKHFRKRKEEEREEAWKNLKVETV